jgi:Tfp pilus assembly protein PilO
LRFTLFKPENHPAADQTDGPRRGMAIQLRAIGSYQAIVRFTSDIAHLPRIVILDPVALQAATGKDDASAGLLALQATAIAIQPDPIHEQKYEHEERNEDQN